MPELMTCPTCAGSTLIVQRNEEDTFFCSLCKEWRPNYPESAQKQRDRAIAEKALVDAGTHVKL